jgi:hypothetical protein
MNWSQSLPRSLAVSGVAVVFALSVALAQSGKDYEPQVGQEGKDVVWVPTPQELVDAMLDMAKVTTDDFVVDLGSGDGRTVITAAKRGIKALGIEYNPNMVELSKRNAAKAGVGDKAQFVRGDIFETDFSQATVVTMFLLPSLNVRLRPKLLEMKPGTRLVSNTFDMGDWQPDQQVQASGCSGYCRGHFWIVPAKVAGTWQTPQGQLVLQQTYQMVTGTLTEGDFTSAVQGKVIGDRIVLTAARAMYSGQVKGGTIEGVAKSGDNETKWQATRGASK